VEFSPHISNRSEPLVVSSVKPLQQFYVVCDNFTTSNPVTEIVQKRAGNLFCEAHIKVTAAGNALSGF
jgi:hypothetical protein